jgi:hypothetical protein
MLTGGADGGAAAAVARHVSIVKYGSAVEADVVVLPSGAVLHASAPPSLPPEHPSFVPEPGRS